MITLSELESGYPKKSSTVPHGLEVKSAFAPLMLPTETQQESKAAPARTTGVSHQTRNP